MLLFLSKKVYWFVRNIKLQYANEGFSHQARMMENAVVESFFFYLFVSSFVSLFPSPFTRSARISPNRRICRTLKLATIALLPCYTKSALLQSTHTFIPTYNCIVFTISNWHKDRRWDQRTDKASFRVASPRLKSLPCMRIEIRLCYWLRMQCIKMNFSQP